MKEQRRNFQIYKIDGVGVDLSKFHSCSEQEKLTLRKELGYNQEDFIITIVAELNKNKNQIMLIKSAIQLKHNIPNLKILLIGKESIPVVRNYVEENKLNDIIQFLGYRNDVDKITMISNLAFSASLREGLPINIIEAMACGIPIVCSDNRGHRSLIKNGITGFIFNPKKSDEMIESILKIYNTPSLVKQIKQNCINEAEKYSLQKAIDSMSKIYMELFPE